MPQEPHVSLFELIMGLSEAVDLISPTLANHHKQVAYIAYCTSSEFELTIEQQNEVMQAGLLHDVGGLSLKDRIRLLQFEIKNPHRHAEIGYLLLKTFEPFHNLATLVRFHHVPWDRGNGVEFQGYKVPIGSHIIHLADRVAVLINKEEEVLGQVEIIRERISKGSGKIFMPELINAFKNLAVKESFWLEATSTSIGSNFPRIANLLPIEFNLEDLIGLARLFSHIIDFRSRFTATHSAGVAATAEALARLAGFSEKECQMMRVAGYLHDLGKLSVSSEILEKPTGLTEAEFNIVRKHTFYTYITLNHISGLDTINSRASFHHERLDGNGYPFHHRDKSLSVGSRIMAVSDVFTALTEDRPYRKGMSKDQVRQVLQQMADSALDSNIISLLMLHYDEVNSLRIEAQAMSAEEYQQFTIF